MTTGMKTFGKFVLLRRQEAFSWICPVRGYPLKLFLIKPCLQNVEEKLRGPVFSINSLPGKPTLKFQCKWVRNAPPHKFIEAFCKIHPRISKSRQPAFKSQASTYNEQKNLFWCFSSCLKAEGPNKISSNSDLNCWRWFDLKVGNWVICPSQSLLDF